MYMAYLQNEITTVSEDITSKQIKKWEAFKNNLLEGIIYYQELFVSSISNENKQIQEELGIYKQELTALMIPEMEPV